MDIELARTEEWPPTFTNEDEVTLTLTSAQYVELDKPGVVTLSVSAVAEEPPAPAPETLVSADEAGEIMAGSDAEPTPEDAP